MRRKDFSNLTKKILFFTGIALAISAASPAFAVNIQPVVSEMVANPGETVEEIYMVRNDLNDTVVVDLHAEPWRQDAGNIVNPDSWLSYEPRVFYLGPNQVQEVTVYAKALEGQSGELRAILYFDETPLNPPPGTMIINRRIGSVVYLGIMGTMVAAIHLQEVRMSHVYSETETTLSGLLTYDNPGNIHIRPLVTVTIKDEAGNIIVKDQLRYGPVAFPGQEKNMSFRWSGVEIPDGPYTMVIDSQFYGEYVDSEAFDLMVEGGVITVTPKEKD